MMAHGKNKPRLQYIAGYLALWGMAAVLSIHPCCFSADPTPQQIASAWAVYAGGLVGKVVFNFNDTMCLLNLNTGQTTKLIRYPQANFSTSNNWGKSSGYRISPDGTRIAAQNGSGVIVCNIDGSGLKVIWTGAPAGDQIALSWDGNDNVIYSSCIANNPAWKISSTAINADNSAGATTILWDRANDTLPNKMAYAGSGFVSVNKCGDFLCFDMIAGANVPIIVKVSTRESRTPIGGNDGCQVRMLMDSTGTISFHRDTHLAVATLYRWGTGVLTQTVPMPPDSMGACGCAGFSWSYNRDYMIQTGDNDLKSSPGCISKARIRKQKALDQIMFLGSNFYWPDLWVGTTITSIDNTSGATYKAIFAGHAFVKISRNDLTIQKAGAEITSARLINLKGAVVALGERISCGTQRFRTTSVPAGAYVVSWRESGIVMSRFVTVE